MQCKYSDKRWRLQPSVPGKGGQAATARGASSLSRALAHQPSPGTNMQWLYVFLVVSSYPCPEGYGSEGRASSTRWIER